MLKIPAVKCVDLLLKYRLPGHQLLHDIRILIYLGLTEAEIDLLVLPEHRDNLCGTLLHYLTYRPAFIHQRILRQMPHRITGRKHNLSLVLLLKTCYDPEQSGFAGAVQTDNADLRSEKK